MHELPINPEKVSLSAPLPLWRFSLAELFLLTTAAAVNFTCWALHPLLGGFVTVLMLPAAARTHLWIRSESLSGSPPGIQTQTMHFFSSCFLFFAGIYICATIQCAVAISGVILWEIFAMDSAFMMVALVICGVLIPLPLMGQVCIVLKNNWPW